MEIETLFTGLFKVFIDNDKRIMVIICGRKKTGKSSIAHYLANRFKEAGVFLRAFTSVDAAGMWAEKDLFAVEGSDRKIVLNGQKIPKNPAPILNIIDEQDQFVDYYPNFTEPENESFFLITHDVNGLLTHLKNDRSENEKLLVLMPLKEYVSFKPLITKYMNVLSVNHSKKG